MFYTPLTNSNVKFSKPRSREISSSEGGEHRAVVTNWKPDEDAGVNRADSNSQMCLASALCISLETGEDV